jgi:cytochrome c556
MKISQFVAATAFAVIAATSASAHQGANGIVGERMDAMMTLSRVLKALTDIRLGDRKYDPLLIREAARVLSHSGGAEMTSKFPPGSNVAPSEARPALWDNWLEFAILANQLSIIGNALDLAVENGMSESPKEDAVTLMGGDQDMSDLRSSQALQLDFEQLSALKFEEIVDVLSQTCTACHTQFRQKSVNRNITP